MKRKFHNLPNHAHFLTFSCYKRQQLLVDDRIRSLLLATWDEARKAEQFRILAYVIMPEHVHLLLFPEDDDYDMSQIMRRLKEPFTRRIVEYWESIGSPMIKKIEAQRGARKVRRFWQTGGGYARNLFSDVAIQKAIEYIEWNPVRRGLVTDPHGWAWSSASSRLNKNGSLLDVDNLETLELKSRAGQ